MERQVSLVPLEKTWAEGHPGPPPAAEGHGTPWWKGNPSQTPPPFFDFSPGTLDLDIRRGRRLASPLTMGKKRNKAIRPKDLKRALKACQFVGLTKRQAAMVILDFLADRGAFGPALFAECKRLVKEKGLA